MIIRKVEIENFRQLQTIELEFQNHLTVLAGPNNSGKTTLSMLLKNLFNSNKMIYTIADVPTVLATTWLASFYPVVNGIFCTNQKEKGLKALMDSITIDSTLKPEFCMPECSIRLTVDYNKDADDIRNFADYLMDLDESKSSFYFHYTFELNIGKFEKILFERYDKIKTICENIKRPDCKEKESKTYTVREYLLQIYCDSLVEKCYFCNADFGSQNTIEVSAFKQLFNFKNIQATRELDDIDSDSSKTLSKRIVSLLKGNSTWDDVTKKLPEKILGNILDADAKTVIQQASVNSLDETIQKISKTSGGNVGKIMLEMDVTEDDVDDFIKKVTRAKYDVDGFLLNESSQGLGFSNLIFLHMQLEEYIRTIDPFKVNVFLIEEPESHMHPQMQNVFIRYLTSFYKEKNLQGVITTHSNEIAKSVGLTNLRVLRQTAPQKSELFDLSKFKEEIKGKSETLDEENTCILEDFYDWFFEIGYSEIIFADKVVLYEGDTERLYIKSLLSLPKLQALKDNYIAFIQVGGAYAYNYKYLIECLKIKTLIITDLDYDKSALNKAEVLKSTSTNSTINKFYVDNVRKEKGLKAEEKVKAPTLKEIYDWQKSEKNIVENLIYIASQAELYYPRTLEEAMLTKLLEIDVFEFKKRSEWLKIRKDNKLKFTVSNNKKDEKDSEFNIRDIVDATSNSKTDFTYSIILNDNIELLLPLYIEEGLLWLMK